MKLGAISETIIDALLCQKRLWSCPITIRHKKPSPLLWAVTEATIDAVSCQERPLSLQMWKTGQQFSQLQNQCQTELELPNSVKHLKQMIAKLDIAVKAQPAFACPPQQGHRCGGTSDLHTRHEQSPF